MTLNSAGGNLVIVGIGIQLGRHVSERAISEIRHAEEVFCLADEFAWSWLQTIRADAVNLAALYGRDKDRRVVYRQMEAAILEPLREGKRVCAVFYGHPGVFADVPHRAIAKARSEGIRARMEPGVSAEACLYADLGLDPGKSGVQCFETTQFLVYQRQLDASALLILWQVALCGDLTCTRFDTTPERLQLLVDKLRRWYPAESQIILYEAAQLPMQPFRADRMTLADLPRAEFVEHTTLVIPSAFKPRRDEHIARILNRPAEAELGRFNNASLHRTPAELEAADLCVGRGLLPN